MPPTADSLTALLRILDQLMTVGQVLLPIARAWGYAFAVFSLVIVCLKGCIAALRHQPEYLVAEFIFWVGRVLFVSFALQHWTTPIPGFGVPFPDLFTLVGTQIAGVIGVATLDTLLTQINNCAQGLEHPPVWNFFGLVVYYFVLLGMTLLDGALLLVTSLGFFAIALGKVFGSILLVFYLLPGWGQKFWNWVNFMVVYSFYRAVAAAVVFVVSTYLVNFFQNTVHGDYTLGHMIPLFVLMMSTIVTVIVFAFKTPSWTVELFGGGLGHAGADFGQSLRSVVFMLLRA